MEDTDSQDRSNSSLYFNSEKLNKSARKPRTVFYQVFHCCKYESNNSETTRGAWSALIVKHPNYLSIKKETQNSSYLVSGIENDNYIRIRLKSILEVLQWITAECPSPDQYCTIEASIFSTDVFIVNTLRDWIGKWSKQIESLDTGTATKQTIDPPNRDLLSQIFFIATRIKLSISWQPEKNIEMDIVVKKANELFSVSLEANN